LSKSNLTLTTIAGVVIDKEGRTARGARDARRESIGVVQEWIGRSRGWEVSQATRADGSRIVSARDLKCGWVLEDLSLQVISLRGYSPTERWECCLGAALGDSGSELSGTNIVLKKNIV